MREQQLNAFFQRLDLDQRVNNKLVKLVNRDKEHKKNLSKF